MCVGPELPPHLEPPAPGGPLGFSGVFLLVRASATTLTSSGMSARVRAAVPVASSPPSLDITYARPTWNEFKEHSGSQPEGSPSQTSPQDSKSPTQEHGDLDRHTISQMLSTTTPGPSLAQAHEVPDSTGIAHALTLYTPISVHQHSNINLV